MSEQENRMPSPSELADLSRLEQAAKVMFFGGDAQSFRMLFIRQRWDAIDSAHHEVTAGFNKIVFPALTAMESFLGNMVLDLEAMQDISDQRGAGATLYKDRRTGAQMFLNRDEVRQFGKNIAWVLSWARERERRTEEGSLAINEKVFGAGIVEVAKEEHNG